jgi:hypothetical protein
MKAIITAIQVAALVFLTGSHNQLKDANNAPIRGSK